MKKVTRGVFSLAVVIVLAGGSLNSGQSSKPVAVLIGVKGDVKVLKSEDSIWDRAEVGDAFYEGDKLRTEEGAEALFILSDDRRIKVRPNSDITFSEQLEAEPGASSAADKLLKGLWSIISQKFSDSKLSAAVGVIRRPGEEEDPKITDAELSEVEKNKLENQVALLKSQISEDSSLHLLLGNLYEAKEQYTSAEVEYKKAIKLSPNEEMLYNVLLDLYLKVRAYKKAETLEKSREVGG